MKQTCEIVQDLLPLYAEGMASSGSRAFVQAHLEACDHCRRAWEQMEEKPPLDPGEVAQAAPLGALKKKLTARRRQAAVLAAIFAAAALIWCFGFLTSPRYFAYDPELVMLEMDGEGMLNLSFDEKVTGFSLSPAREDATGRTSYTLTCWTTMLDELLPRSRGQRSAKLNPKDTGDIYYAQNDGQEDVILWSRLRPGGGGRITLPRLVLGPYLVMAAGGFALLGAAWLIFRRSRWLGRGMTLAGAYVLAHFSVCGLRTVSFDLMREFGLILTMTAVLYAGIRAGLRLLRMEQ